MRSWQSRLFIRRSIAALVENAGGVASIEFAFVLPIMLVLFFGTVEISNGIAVYRNVTQMAHTLSDLTSQSTSVQDSDLTNFFAASTGVMTPYSTTPISQTITEIWMNPAVPIDLRAPCSQTACPTS